MPTTKIINPVVLCSCFVALFSTGCSLEQAPTESQARQIFESTLSAKRGFGGERLENYQVTSFKKTDGLASTENGISKYNLIYEASMEYPEGNNSFCLDSNTPPPPGKNHFLCLSDYANVHPVGAVHNVKGVVQFIKTENGWQSGEAIIKCDRGHMSHQWCSL